MQVMEIYNFTQDDLMTEDIFILDCHSDIFVWVGQQVDTKNKLQALTIGQVRSAGYIGGNYSYTLLSKSTIFTHQHIKDVEFSHVNGLVLGWSVQHLLWIRNSLRSVPPGAFLHCNLLLDRNFLSMIFS